jgi:N-acetylneuraminic acid mutarotase
VQEQGDTSGRALRLLIAAALLAALLALTAAAWGRANPEVRAATVGPLGLAGAGTSATSEWRPLQSSSLERTEVGAARIGGSIYVVGGFTRPSHTTATVESYEIDRDRWQRLPSMPVAVNHPAVTSYEGFLYVYGGYRDASFGPVTAALQRYDPVAAKWKLLPPAPTPRAAAAMVGLGGKLFAVGGVGNDEVVGTLEVYDIAERQWRTARPMRVAREHIAAVATDDGIYVFGGRSNGHNLNVVERFDPERGRWTRLPDLLRSRSGFAAVVVEGKPIVFGGEELTPEGGTIRSVELYDPAARRWRSLPGMRTPRHGLGGAELGRRIYALQGGPTPGFAFSGGVEFLDVPGRLLR